MSRTMCAKIARICMKGRLMRGDCIGRLERRRRCRLELEFEFGFGRDGEVVLFKIESSEISGAGGEWGTIRDCFCVPTVISRVTLICRCWSQL